MSCRHLLSDPKRVNYYYSLWASGFLIHKKGMLSWGLQEKDKCPCTGDLEENLSRHMNFQLVLEGHLLISNDPFLGLPLPPDAGFYSRC